MQSNIESGLQLFARLRHRHNTLQLDNTIFPNGLKYNDIVEISGDVANGKTLLLSQYIAKCILPVKYEQFEINGCNSCAILINTDHHFQVSKLVSLMFTIVANSSVLNSTEKLNKEIINSIVFNALNNLTLINCYNIDQFLLTIHALENMFLQNKQIAFLGIDSITAFYWQHREFKGVCSVDLYIKNLIKIIQTHTVEFKILLMYTKFTVVKANDKEHLKQVSYTATDPSVYKIQLHKGCAPSKFYCSVKWINEKKVLSYTIHEDSLKWNVEKQEETEQL